MSFKTYNFVKYVYLLLLKDLVFCTNIISVGKYIQGAFKFLWRCKDGHPIIKNTQLIFYRKIT